MINWELDYGNEQHQGTRKQQEDYFASLNPTRAVVESHGGFLAVVADGMGGHEGGERASYIAVTTFLEEYQNKSKNYSIPDALNRSMFRANSAVCDENERRKDSNMGTTLTACVLQANKMYWISVGDSSIMLYHNGELLSVNEEHSVGAEIERELKAGQISPDQAFAENAKRNQLTSYLGMRKIPQIDFSKIPYDLKEGDKVLLCTDGLRNSLNTSEINECMQINGTAQEKCELLIQQTLEKGYRNQDNVTTVLMEIRSYKITTQARKSQRKNSLIVIVGALIASILIGVILYYSFQRFINEDPNPPVPVQSQNQPASPEEEPKKNNIQPKVPEKKNPIQSIDNQPASSGDGTEKNNIQLSSKKDIPIQSQENQGGSQGGGGKNINDTKSIQPHLPQKKNENLIELADEFEKKEFECNCRNAQIVLKALKLYNFSIDGKCEGRTEAAINVFQQQLQRPDFVLNDLIHDKKPTGKLKGDWKKPTCHELKKEFIKFRDMIKKYKKSHPDLFKKVSDQGPKE